MIYKSFDELIAKVQGESKTQKVVVAAAQDEHTLQAALRAKKDRIVEPILIGDSVQIEAILKGLGEHPDQYSIIYTKDDMASAQKAVELIRDGKADFIMKGKIQTADLLRAVVNKEKGLRTGCIMSHLTILELPGYHKLLAITDGGMILYPNLAEKKQILENAVKTFRDMGYQNPKVAVLTAVETVNPKMPETVDADALKKMNKSGEISGCIVAGPISYDLTMSKESAAIKGYESPVTEDADILIVSNIAVGNILGKALTHSAGAKMAGFIVGAKVPIVVTSRGSTAEEKYLSLVLSAAAIKHEQ